jgi:hypothetical protein
MAKQYTIKRKIGDVAIVSNGFNTIDLPRDYDYQAIGLRIEASVAVSVANATSVRAEAPCQIVPRIEVIADGKNNLFSAPFWYTALANLDRPLGESGARAVTPPTSPNIATYATEAIGIIDFQHFEGIRPKDSNFRSRGLSLLQLRLTFGAAADVFVVGGATVAYSGSPVVSVFAMQEVEDTDDKGNYLTSPVALKKVSYQEQAFASSNANAEILLPAGNAISKVMIRTDGTTTAGEPSTTVLNNVQLANGIDVRLNLSAKNLRALNNADYGLVLAGYYMCDPLKSGTGGNLKLSQLWDLSGATQPKAVLDVTGGANVKAQVVTTEMILARG